MQFLLDFEFLLLSELLLLLGSLADLSQQKSVSSLFELSLVSLDLEAFVKVNMMCERHGSLVGPQDVQSLSSYSRNPVRELLHILHSGAEHDDSHVFGEHDDGLLPDSASLLVVYVVHLVEDYPLQTLQVLVLVEEFLKQDLGGHNETVRVLPQNDVSRDDSHVVVELLRELEELLVRESLDWRSEDHSGSILQRFGNGVLRNHGFPRGSVSGHENILTLLNEIYCPLLEFVQLKGRLLGQFDAPEVGVDFLYRL